MPWKNKGFSTCPFQKKKRASEVRNIRIVFKLLNAETGPFCRQMCKRGLFFTQESILIFGFFNLRKIRLRVFFYRALLRKRSLKII